MPEDQARSGKFLDGKQIELLAQHAVVTLLGLFDAVEILIEIFL